MLSPKKSCNPTSQEQYSPTIGYNALQTIFLSFTIQASYNINFDNEHQLQHISWNKIVIFKYMNILWHWLNNVIIKLTQTKPYILIAYQVPT
jgi:hypothetical protein